jgi:hypothetical protein
LPVLEICAIKLSPQTRKGAQADLKLATGQHREALRGIVLLLLSLACLAERVARRALPVRAFVLWLLYRSEVVAHGFVVDEVECSSAQLRLPPVLCHHGGHSPGDAMRLAGRFRALAATLNLLSGQARRLVRRLRARSPEASNSQSPMHRSCLRASQPGRAGEPANDRAFAHWRLIFIAAGAPHFVDTS